MPGMNQAQGQDTHVPRVSIGLPVYNAEDFLEEAVDSLLAQTFTDFELIISDNASTDRTEEICHRYAARDQRLRYYRNAENMGGAWNFNRVVELARGEYFRWAAHDDVAAPALIQRCVEVLDQKPDVIMAYPEAVDIDENGEFYAKHEDDLHEDDPRPYHRFRYMISLDHACVIMFGVVRTEVLRRTPMIQGFLGADRVFLSELCLLGTFYEVPEELFFRREHAGRSQRAYRDPSERIGWFDPKKRGMKTYPLWKITLEYIRVIGRVKLSLRDKLGCYFQVLRWFKWYWKTLLRELRRVFP